MKANKSKVSEFFVSASAIGGIFYAARSKKSLGVTFLYVLGFAAVGLFVGNQVEKHL